jgi:hypothetical protein
MHRRKRELTQKSTAQLVVRCYVYYMPPSVAMRQTTASPPPPASAECILRMPCRGTRSANASHRKSVLFANVNERNIVVATVLFGFRCVCHTTDYNGQGTELNRTELLPTEKLLFQLSQIRPFGLFQFIITF